MPVRWNPLPIVVRSGFAFRRVIRSASDTLFLSARIDEERNRKTLPLHSFNSRSNYCCHSRLRTVGRRIVEIVPRMLQCRRYNTDRIYREPGLWLWRLNPTDRNTRELLMMPIADVMREKSWARLWRRRLRVPSELQRFDNAERVPCDIMRNGCEHALRFTNLDDELYLLSNYNLFHTSHTHYDSHIFPS